MQPESDSVCWMGQILGQKVARLHQTGEASACMLAVAQGRSTDCQIESCLWIQRQFQTAFQSSDGFLQAARLR